MLVAIVIPVVVGVLLLGVAVVIIAVLKWQRQQRREQQQRSQQRPQQQQRSGSSSTTSSRCMAGTVSASNRLSRPAAASSKHSHPKADLDVPPSSYGSSGLMRAPLGGTRGWEISSTLTIPLLAEHMADAVELGEVLGAGSTFRCFRGRWAGRAVAVKVFDHDADATPAVEAELHQVMSFSHPNLVQCFHAITYTHAISHTTAASTQSPPSMPDTHSSGLETLELPQRTVSMLSISMPDRSSISGSMSGPAGRGGVVGSFSDISHGIAPRVHSTGAGSVHASAASFCDPSGLSMTLPTRGISSYSLGPQPSAPLQHLQAAASCTSGSSHFEDSALLFRCSDKQAAAVTSTISSASAAGSSSQALPCMRFGSGSSSSLPGPFALTASADSSQAVSSFVLPSARTSLSSAGPSGAWAGTAVVGTRCSGAAAAAETWVVQELCDLGSAASIAASWRLEPESVRQMVLRLRLLQDAAQGLKELHRLNLIHGDLNAHNVLICTNSKAPSGMQGKLVDYSLSRLAKQLAARQAASVKSLSHQPPEVLKLGRATAAADIYALGVMMWELYTGHAAFRKLHMRQFYEAVILRNLRPLVPPAMPRDYQLLMERCWATDPTDRPSIDRVLECLKHMLESRTVDLQQPSQQHKQQHQQHQPRQSGPSLEMAWANVCRSSLNVSHQPPAAAAAAAAAVAAIASSTSAMRNKTLPLQPLQQPQEALQAPPFTGSSYYTWVSAGFPGSPGSQWMGAAPLSSSKHSTYSSAGPPTPLQQSPAVRPVPVQQLQQPPVAGVDDSHRPELTDAVQQHIAISMRHAAGQRRSLGSRQLQQQQQQQQDEALANPRPLAAGGDFPDHSSQLPRQLQPHYHQAWFV